jgi:hypothetical protein
MGAETVRGTEKLSRLKKRYVTYREAQRNGTDLDRHIEKWSSLCHEKQGANMHERME